MKIHTFIVYNQSDYCLTYKDLIKIPIHLLDKH